MIEKINASNDLYEILGCSRFSSDSKEMRKNYMHRARHVHPESVHPPQLPTLRRARFPPVLSTDTLACYLDRSKFRSFPPATSAFQKLSFAFTVLSDPASKRLYDASPSTSSGSRTSFPSSFWSHDGGFEGGVSAGDLRAADETLNGVLFQVWTEVSRVDLV